MKDQVYAYLRCYPNLIHADVSKLRESFTRREGIKSVVWIRLDVCQGHFSDVSDGLAAKVAAANAFLTYPRILRDFQK